MVKALGESPWGTFTVAGTIPIALSMGIYMRYIRPGKILEVSDLRRRRAAAGTIWYGQYVSHSPTLGPLFTFSAPQLAWVVIAYGFVASMLPVWLLLAPRDYLSTFLKIGIMAALAIGIFIVQPELKMPATDAFHRRHRAGGVGLAVPVPVHHHRLRLRVGLPRADRLRHDAEDDRATKARPATSATAAC